MKKEAFKIVRRYRKSFCKLASKYPKDSFKYWQSYFDKLNELLDLLAHDNTITHHEYILMLKYFYKNFHELYIIYCK